MSPVEQTATSPAAHAEQPPATCSAVRWVSRKPAGPGAGVRAAGVEDHRVDPAVGDDLPGPDHRRGLHPVAREDRRGRAAGAVVDHERDVRPAARLEPGRHPGRPEALRRGDAHGATPTIGSPRVSGRPSARLRDCSAAPPVPFVRLSMAATTTTRRDPPVDGDLQERGVRAEGVRRAGPAALGEHVDERLVGVGLHPGLAHGVGVDVRGAAAPCRSPGCRAAIGASVGVKLDPDRACRRGGQVLHHLRGVAVDAADPVRRHRAQRPPPRAGAAAGFRPAPEVPDAATTTTSSGSSSPAAKPGARASDDGGRVAAGDGDPAGTGERRPLPGAVCDGGARAARRARCRRARRRRTRPRPPGR